MKFFVLCVYFSGGFVNRGVYSSKEKAEEVMKDKTLIHNEYYIEEFELDKVF